MTLRRALALLVLLLPGLLPARGEVRPIPGDALLSPTFQGCVYEHDEAAWISIPAEECVEEAAAPAEKPDPSLLRRIVRYGELAVKHRVSGLASYYSGFFDGRKTANGEIFRNGKYSAAHLTLPLGTWVEVKSRATGKTIRLRVNDRGPYAPKFFLDLSQAAARYLGVDVARDRFVDIRIIALPGEEPLPEGVEVAEISAAR